MTSDRTCSATGHSDLEFVVGKVEDTIPARAPETIAPAAPRHRLVRIDPPRTGDLYPRLSPREASSSSTTTDTGRAHGRRWTNTSALARSFSIGSITPGESRSNRSSSGRGALAWRYVPTNFAGIGVVTAAPRSSPPSSHFRSTVPSSTPSRDRHGSAPPLGANACLYRHRRHYV